MFDGHSNRVPPDKNAGFSVCNESAVNASVRKPFELAKHSDGGVWLRSGGFFMTHGNQLREILMQLVVS